MTATSTVTVDIVPKIDAEAIDTIVRQAVADALRRLADSMTVRPATAPDDEPRFYAEKINDIWGVRDRETPDEWAGWGSDVEDRWSAQVAATTLNEGVPREAYEWTATGTL